MQTETTQPNRSIIVPSLDVLAKDGDLRLLVDLPGVQRDGLSLAVEKGVLTIEATRADQPGSRYHRQVRLPDGIDVDAVDATLEHGLLTVSLPQAERLRRRTIEVRG